MQHGVYKVEGLPVPPAQPAVGQSGAVFSGGVGQRNAWRISGDSSKIPRRCLPILTLEEVKENVELKFLNWEKRKYY